MLTVGKCKHSLREFLPSADLFVALTQKKDPYGSIA